MGASCDVCHRRPQYGSRVSHSNRRTNRRFKVNVQHRRVVVDGVARNVYICTRCLRNMVKVPKQRKRAAKSPIVRVTPVAAPTPIAPTTPTELTTPAAAETPVAAEVSAPEVATAAAPAAETSDTAEAE